MDCDPLWNYCSDRNVYLASQWLSFIATAGVEKLNEKKWAHDQTKEKLSHLILNYFFFSFGFFPFFQLFVLDFPSLCLLMFWQVLTRFSSKSINKPKLVNFKFLSLNFRVWSSVIAVWSRFYLSFRNSFLYFIFSL